MTPSCRAAAVFAPTAAALVGLTWSAFAHPASEHSDGPQTLAAPHRAADAEPDPAPRVSITVRDGFRYITSNGLADHPTGRFPNPGNPHAIAPQTYTFRVPLEPTPDPGNNLGEAGRPVRALFGVALNGVPFDPGTAEVWSPDGRTRGGRPDPQAWRYEALTSDLDLGLDPHHAHVQPTGAYHYHALPVGLYQRLAAAPADRTPGRMVLLGYAADGFPCYGVYGHQNPDDPRSPLVELQPGYQLKPGQRPPKSQTSPGGKHDGTFVQDWQFLPGHGDLDRHNGRTGVTPEYPQGTYYYVISRTYPFVPRSFLGQPDPSFIKQASQRRGRDADAPPRPRDRPRNPPPRR